GTSDLNVEPVSTPTARLMGDSLSPGSPTDRSGSPDAVRGRDPGPAPLPGGPTGPSAPPGAAASGPRRSQGDEGLRLQTPFPLPMGPPALGWMMNTGEEPDPPEASPGIPDLSEQAITMESKWHVDCKLSPTEVSYEDQS